MRVPVLVLWCGVPVLFCVVLCRRSCVAGRWSLVVSLIVRSYVMDCHLCVAGCESVVW